MDESVSIGVQYSGEKL